MRRRWISARIITEKKSLTDCEMRKDEKKKQRSVVKMKTFAKERAREMLLFRERRRKLMKNVYIYIFVRVFERDGKWTEVKTDDIYICVYMIECKKYAKDTAAGDCNVKRAK